MTRLALTFILFALTSSTQAQKAQSTDIEGKGPAFAASGATFAWAVLKAPEEARTTVVIRVSAAGFRSVSASGSDAAGKEKVWIPRSQLPRAMDVRIARTSLTQYPRTIIRFYREERGVVGVKPEFEVFFAGMPEGTREFTDAAEMERYLKNPGAPPQ